jgi:uncharacterized membrane protein YcaP (DUF421 family)
MDPGAVAIRAAFAYVFLLAMLRMSSKRTVAQGTPMDFVLALIVGDLIDDLLWGEVAAAQFVTAISILVVTHLVVQMAVFQFPLLRRWVEGRERPLVEEGRLVRAGMRRERLNKPEVMAILRSKSVKDMREIKAADVELSGAVSVLNHDWAKEVQKQDRANLVKA